MGRTNLGNDDVLLTVLGPTPRTGALAGLGTKIGVRVEGVQVHVLASELASLSFPARRLALVLLPLLGAGVDTLLTEVLEVRTLDPHDLLVHLTRQVSLVNLRVLNLLRNGGGSAERHGDDRELHNGGVDCF